MKNILITGGAEGLGHCLAVNYAENGYKVTVLDLQQKESTDNIRYIEFDLAHFDERILEQLDEPYDTVICNAGISISGNFKEIPYEKELEVFDVNVFGHIQLVKYLLRKNLIKDFGRIAFICSASEYLPFPIALAYSSSKSALDGFARALESFTYDEHISITRIFPGPMNTSHKRFYPGAQQEGGRKPEESVPAIVAGIEQRKRKIFPDPISKFYRIAAKIAPRWLCKKTYSFYKERL